MKTTPPWRETALFMTEDLRSHCTLPKNESAKGE